MEKLNVMQNLLYGEPQFDKLDVHFKSIFTALHDTLEKTKIDKEDLKSLLFAFKQDVNKNRYYSFDDLLEYSKFSAEPVGSLILQLFGFDKKVDSELFNYSNKICSALQFANFWQDVSIDLLINRIYVPFKNMQEHKYSEDDLFAKVENDKFKRIMKELVDRTDNMFYEGIELPKHLTGTLKYEINATIKGGMKILELIRKNKYKVLSNRVKLSKGNKLVLLLKSML